MTASTRYRSLTSAPSSSILTNVPQRVHAPPRCRCATRSQSSLIALAAPGLGAIELREARRARAELPARRRIREQVAGRGDIEVGVVARSDANAFAAEAVGFRLDLLELVADLRRCPDVVGDGRERQVVVVEEADLE